jgi:hypothetical protein
MTLFDKLSDWIWSSETFFGSKVVDQISPGDLKDTPFLDKPRCFRKKLGISVKRGSFQTAEKCRNSQWFREAPHPLNSPTFLQISGVFSYLSRFIEISTGFWKSRHFSHNLDRFLEIFSISASVPRSQQGSPTHETRGTNEEFSDARTHCLFV